MDEIERILTPTKHNKMYNLCIIHEYATYGINARNLQLISSLWLMI